MMASFEITGLDELNAAFNRVMGGIPDEVTAEAVTAMAEVAKEKIRESGLSMGVRDPESGVHILDKIKLSKPKISSTGGYVDVYFSGTRKSSPESKARVKNTVIAFENEYGNRQQQARPFVGNAMVKNEEAIVAPGAQIIGDWMENEFLK